VSGSSAATTRAPEASAQEEYGARLAVHRGMAERWAVHERWLSHARLVIFGVGLLAGWLSFGTHTIARGWLLPVVLVFLALVVAHDQVIRRRSRAERAAAFYERGLARLEDRWAGEGTWGERFRDPLHPYAEDLDLFGRGSLFELICTARTPAGESALAGWLLEPAEPERIRARQAAVTELRARLELREDIALVGEDIAPKVDPEALVRWGREGVPSSSAAARATAAAAALLTVSSLAAWIFSGSGPVPFAFAIGLQSALALGLRGRVQPTIKSVDRPTRDLRLLGELLERLEREEVTSPLLVSLRASLATDDLPPSRRIAQLQRLVDLLDARRNQLFAPIGALLLWGTQLALAIESWRARCGPALGEWIDAAAQMEALCALAGYAYEHPRDPFPELVAEGPLFEGRGLGHPLLPEARCVRNDLTLGAKSQACVVSGSNMSGKSTMLRTVGVNALLAQAGAPVRATHLRMSPLSVAASIRVTDSLQAGISHFYAEIKRLRQVVDIAQSRPALFLLDEILHGTNSHDRRIGADAVIRELLEHGAIGLVTTHDLALAKIADELAPRLANVHFEDHLEDGEMCFDYALHPGVVTKSNAIALMRAVGLEV